MANYGYSKNMFLLKCLNNNKYLMNDTSIFQFGDYPYMDCPLIETYGTYNANLNNNFVDGYFINNMSISNHPDNDCKTYIDGKTE